jgi:hypothetical protein
VFSICTQFVENEGEIPTEEELLSPDYDEPGKDRMKQDCEIKAFYRLAANLKKACPRLRICITADGLYACKQVFEICREYDWRFIIRFKEGSIPSLYNTYLRATTQTDHYFRIYKQKGAIVPESEAWPHVRDPNSGYVKLEYIYANGLQYENFSLNMAECIDSGVDYPFLFVTDLPIDDANCERTIADGKRRWKIENEAFKVQKQHGYYLKHVFCKDYNAMKIHYLAIQIAHAISQLLEHSTDVIELLHLTKKEFHVTLLKCFCALLLTPEDFAASVLPRKIRLSV